MAMTQYKSKTFGPLPHDLINDTLGTELAGGKVILSVRAHEHIARDHPLDYASVMASIDVVLASPGYIGQAPRHARNFEMVRRVRLLNGTAIVLVALSLERNQFGNYNIRSGYCLKEDDVTTRVTNGHLIIPKRKGP